MNTPMQELIEQLKTLKYLEINDRAWIACDSVIDIAEVMLEKEKDVMCEFADDYQRDCFQKSPYVHFEETFNTKER